MAGDKKQRIDVLLVELGLVPSRSRAQGFILAGQVLVDERVVDKVGQKVKRNSQVRLRGQDHPYVGRGGLKLQYGIEDFELDVQGLRCVDLGASTGGFTDCLLQRGATWVAAVDVGTNQLDWRLRSDDRVLVFEQCDVRQLDPSVLPEPADLAVMDLSFIGLAKVLAYVPPLLKGPGARVLALVKPQFEVGREHVAKGGVVKDQQRREEAIAEVIEFAQSIGFELLGRRVSRLPGAKKGNVEEFILLQLGPEAKLNPPS